MGEDKAALELHAPAGFWAKFTGITSSEVMHFVIVMMLGALIWMINKSDHDRELRYADLKTQMSQMALSDKESRERQEAMLKGLQNITLEQQATTYVLTLTPEERNKLRLAVPEKLRDRVR
jgi:hypothetical protein